LHKALRAIRGDAYLVPKHLQEMPQTLTRVRPVFNKVDAVTHLRLCNAFGRMCVDWPVSSANEMPRVGSVTDVSRTLRL
jgi:hypothetical protein